MVCGLQEISRFFERKSIYTTPNSVDSISSFCGIKVKICFVNIGITTVILKAGNRNHLEKSVSIDDSYGALYTILTNKAAEAKKGVIVTIVAGTKEDTEISV